MPKNSPFIHTPLIPSIPLSKKCQKDVYLKLDALQPSGSFKLRGVSLVCQKAKSRGIGHIISSSGGNAGLAAAWAGNQLGLKVSVYVPEPTPNFVCKILESYGANVTKTGSQWIEAHTAALAHAEDPGTFLVHPFDMEDLWQGHSSIIEEIKSDLGNEAPDGIIASVGGGGLAQGILLGLETVSWQQTPLIAVETEGADSLAQSLKAGKLVTLDKINSVAKSLGADRVSERFFENCQSLGPKRVRSAVVSDAEAIDACRQFLDDHRILVEPACGAALAIVYQNHEVIKECKKLVIEVCGGALVNRDILNDLISKHL